MDSENGHSHKRMGILIAWGSRFESRSRSKAYEGSIDCSVLNLSHLKNSDKLKQLPIIGSRLFSCPLSDRWSGQEKSVCCVANLFPIIEQTSINNNMVPESRSPM